MGYELEGPASAAVTAGTAAQHDLRLRKTQDVSAQLTNGEWFQSWPGTDRHQERVAELHAVPHLQPIVRSHYTADQWVPVLQRMARYSQGSTPTRPQLRPNTHGGGVEQSHPAAKHGWARRRGAGGGGPHGRHRCIPRVDQPQRRAEVAVSAQDLPSSDGQGNARHHHRVRPAASGDAAARRGRRFRTA